MREDTIARLRRLYAEATPGRMEYDGERGWVLDESGDVALRSCTWGIGPLAADALSTLPALLDVAEAAEKERRRLVEDGCDLLHDHHADCIDAEMVEADRCDRCRRLDGLDTVLARLEEAE